MENVTDSEADSGTPYYFEMFMGAVPPFHSFMADFNLLGDVMKAFPDSESDDGPPNPATSACFIAAVAHFEAFTKNLFAAVINICPRILQGYSRKRPDEAIRLCDLVHVNFDLDRTLGFLMAEHRDFGSPKSLNAMFYDLLGFTPFSKEEVSRFGELLDLRNLFVHHGGVFTSGYARRHGLSQVSGLTYLHSPPLSMASLVEAMDFFHQSARKMTLACWKAISAKVEGESWKLEQYQLRALEELSLRPPKRKSS